MSHIIEEYEKNLGVDRHTPVISKHFFPLDCEKFILFHAPKDIPAKVYKHYFMVIDLLKDFCKSEGLNIFQIGKEEEFIDGVDKIFCDLSFRQQAYIISKASVFVCVDNVYSQYASSQNVPVVNLFSNVYSSVTKGAWKNKQINIEPDWKVKPCLQHVDPEQSIDYILPETIVKSILKLLNTKSVVNFETYHIGNAFYKHSIDVVPTDYKNLKLFEGKVLNIRADYDFNENAFLNYCWNHKCRLVFRNFVIPPSQLHEFAQNIERITFIFDSIENPVDEKYFDILKSMDIDVDIVITKEEDINQARYLFFNQDVTLYKPQLTRPEGIPEDANFFSFKKVIEGDKFYSSKAHWRNKEIPLDKRLKILDNADYWEDLDFYYIYGQH